MCARVHSEARFSGGGVGIRICVHMEVLLCECLFVLIFAVFSVCVYECGLAAEQTCFGTGTPNSVAAKVRSAAVPVNDV